MAGMAVSVDPSRPILAFDVYWYLGHMRYHFVHIPSQVASSSTHAGTHAEGYRGLQMWDSVLRTHFHRGTVLLIVAIARAHADSRPGRRNLRMWR